MKVTYDPSVDAHYVHVRDGEIVGTIEAGDDLYYDLDAEGFRRYGSARQLYNFKVDNAGAY